MEVEGRKVSESMWSEVSGIARRFRRAGGAGDDERGGRGAMPVKRYLQPGIVVMGEDDDVECQGCWCTDDEANNSKNRRTDVESRDAKPSFGRSSLSTHKVMQKDSRWGKMDGQRTCSAIKSLVSGRWNAD